MATPTNYPASKIKSLLLQPALTTHYQVYINISSDETLKSPSDGTLSTFMKGFGANLVAQTFPEVLTLSCSEASLPGSSLMTQELNDDYTGITQRHAYRRTYDDRIDFTFYVNQNYEQILFFERWMQYISGEQATTNQENHFIRFKFPQLYKRRIYIDKFEKSAQSKSGKDSRVDDKSVNGSYTGSKIQYEFINAFPISVNSMPVSYDGAQLLKCTVAFSYDRYLMKGLSTVSTPTTQTGFGEALQGGLGRGGIPTNTPLVTNQPEVPGAFDNLPF